MSIRCGNRIIFSYLCLFTILTATIGSAVSCKQKTPDKAIAIFVIGEVRLVRPGEQERPVKHKDVLFKEDFIKTGPDSVLVFQIGADSLIQLEPNTQVKMTSFMEQGVTRLGLIQGKVFSNIHRLRKGELFQVDMKTSVAAVRGTEFSAAQTKKDSVVAVSKGTITVQSVNEKNEVKEEKTIENGNAAVVKDTISTRPLTGSEEKELAQFDKTSPIDDIESKSESDLKSREDDFQKNRGADKTDDAKKTLNKGEKSRTAVADKTLPATDKKETPGTIWTGKKVYGPSDAVVVNYKNLPNYWNCWISISKSGSPDRSYEAYDWTKGNTNGQMTFPTLKLEPGNYEVRVHFSRGNEVNMRYNFRVK